MQTEELTHLLQQSLQSQEYIVWSQRPDPTRRAQKQRWFRGLGYYMVLRIFLLTAVFLTVIVYPLSQGYDLLFSNWPIVGLMAIVPVFIVGLVFAQRIRAKQRLRNTIYAITNKRAILLTVDATRIATKSLGPQELGTIHRIERRDGWGDVVFGQQQVQQVGVSTIAVSTSFCGIADVRSIENLLIRLSQTRAA